jgi:hypothetical protein
VPRIFTQEHETFRDLAREILGREVTPFRAQDTSGLFFTDVRVPYRDRQR